MQCLSDLHLTVRTAVALLLQQCTMKGYQHVVVITQACLRLQPHRNRGSAETSFNAYAVCVMQCHSLTLLPWL
jgi:hypothetical protein